MRLQLAVIAALMLFLPALALAQEQDCQINKAEKTESFVLPYTASNQDDDSPIVCTFDEPKQPSWIHVVRPKR
jgi:hypothetical protein